MAGARALSNRRFVWTAGVNCNVHFWNSDQWSIQTEQELFEPKMDEKQYDAPRMGGMTLG